MKTKKVSKKEEKFFGFDTASEYFLHEEIRKQRLREEAKEKLLFALEKRVEKLEKEAKGRGWGLRVSTVSLN